MYMTAATGIRYSQRRCGTADAAADVCVMSSSSGLPGGRVGRAQGGRVGGEVDGGVERGPHGLVRGRPGAGDVEGRAVVDRGAQDRQADGDRDRAVEVEGLGRDVPLVVVLREHTVVAAGDP